MLVRDGNGHVVPHQDASLADEDILIRRVTSVHLQPSDLGKRRISKSSMAGSSRDRDPYQGMSLDLLRILNEQGIDVTDAAQYHPDIEVLIGLRVGAIREQCPELMLGRCPILNPPNEAHCCAWGVSKESTRKRLLKIATIIRAPADIENPS